MPKNKSHQVVVAMMVNIFLTGCSSIRRRFVGLPGSPPTEDSRAVADGGIKVVEWNGKIDAAELKAGMTIADARLSKESGALHVTTGQPSAIGRLVQLPQEATPSQQPSMNRSS